MDQTSNGSTQLREQRVALVTGASRGIGAATARRLAQQGPHVLVNYREKRNRAETIVASIGAAGGAATAIGADLTDRASTEAMISEVARDFGRLDLLILNASGGLERGASADYAMRINRDAQLDLVKMAWHIMPPGSRIVFVTSHQAHFHRRKPVPAEYVPIAASKRAGEDALRSLIPELDSRGIGLVVVSGDMIEGTIIVRLLERRNRAALDTRRAHGALPTIAEFADAIVAAADSREQSGHTVYVGGDDYLTGHD